jgi:hypothetical protein
MKATFERANVVVSACEGSAFELKVDLSVFHVRWKSNAQRTGT